MLPAMRTVAALVLVGLTWIGNAFAQKDWREYRYAEDHFVISAPSQPELLKQHTPAGTELRMYVVDLGGGRMMTVVVGPAPATPPSEQKSRAACENGANNVHARVTQQEKKVIAGTAGWSCLYQNDRLRFRTDAVMGRGRFFQITAAGPLSDGALPREAERFFTSFRLIEQ